jgi:hypothetical protein
LAILVFDRNSGFGIVMAYPALAAAPEVFLDLQNIQLTDANHNNTLDSDECADVVLTLHNSTGVAVTGITGVLTSSTPQVFVDPAPRSFRISSQIRALSRLCRSTSAPVRDTFAPPTLFSGSR